MSKFTKKDGHPRFAHFAIFVFLIMATTFGLTKIGNRSLPDALAQTSGLTHYLKMDVDTGIPGPGGPVETLDLVTGTSPTGDWPGYISIVPNGGKSGGALKFTAFTDSYGLNPQPERFYLASAGDLSFKNITPPWSFMAWVKLTARSHIDGVYGTTDAPIFASQNMTDYCGLQIMIENATSTPTYKLIFDVMDCVGGTGKAHRKSVTSTIPVPHSNTNGLVASYSFNKTASSSAGFGYDGVLFGSPSYTDASPPHVDVSDRRTQTLSALSLNGSSQYVNLGDVFNAITVPFTVSAWVRHQGSATDKPILASDDETNYTGFNFWVEGGSSELGVATMSGGGSGSGYRRTKLSTQTVPIGVWTHVSAVVRSQTDISLYIGGVDAGGSYSGTGGSMIHNASNARIGKRATNFFIGDLDEVKLFNRALTASEIQNLYAGDAQWAHIAVVAKGVPDANNTNNVRLYINGEDKTAGPVDGTASIPSGTFPFSASASYATLGSRLSGLGGDFIGYMDDVKIYNRALSSCEIKVSSGSSSSCPNGRCEQSCGENFLNCWADCKPKAFRDF